MIVLLLVVEVSSEICCSGVASRYFCYGNQAAGSNQIWKFEKLFILSAEN